MIIEKSLDKFLLSIFISEYSTRDVVRYLERLQQSPDNVKLLPYVLESVSSLALFKSGSLYYKMNGQIGTHNTCLLSLFSIDFVYNFFKTIVESIPPNQLTLKLLFQIFKDSYAAYAQSVGLDQLKKDLPQLDEDEINYVSLLVDRFISDDFSNVSRGFRNDIIN